MNFHKFIIARLNGRDIEKEFDYYFGLAKKGIAGFIIFGGELNAVREGIIKLQREAKGHLIIASDLERGLGQQLEGGTTFPPAMAIASAIKSYQLLAISHQQKILLRRVFKTVALEARYAGINTIFAPVLDINTNPKNPIISTRAFGEDAETVSFFGTEMIRVFQENSITACGKHFPGHGDTEIDSHIRLPVINKNLRSLEKTELAPFRNAVKQGVKMIMLGHLKVPALDASGMPVSLSQKAVSYLRNKLGFKGVIITDAMNMGGIGRYSEEKAALMALNAGVDFLLHPTDPDKVVSYLKKKLSGISVQPSANKLFKKKIKTSAVPDFEKNRKLSEKITKMSIKIDGRIKRIKNPLVIILNDDIEDKGRILIETLKRGHRNLKFLRFKTGEDISLNNIPENRELIVAVFSGIRAWKGGASSWLLKSIKRLERRADVLISFGSPYLIDNIRKDVGDCPRFTDRAERSRRIGTVPAVKIYAYWDQDSAQRAVAEIIIKG
jgi:beta-glucosidase-like glycosyl hydrolase